MKQETQPTRAPTSRLLAGRRILVTGSARGLGLAFAQALCEHGAAVSLIDLREEQLHRAVEGLRSQGFTASGFTADLGDPAAIERSAQAAVRELGGLDGLVNNAAVTDSGGRSLMEIDVAKWDQVMSVNVRGTWLMTRACAPALRAAASGSIVNLASDTALWGAPNLLAYVASKGAVIAMTHSMARELGADGVTVNAIAPGLVQVEATQYVPEQRHRHYQDQRAIARNQVPEDVTGAVVWLQSPLSRFVTGQVIAVNGGFVMH